MAKFFVGQRVRLARPLHPENAGAQGTISFLGNYVPGELILGCVTTQTGDCTVLWDDGEHAQQWQSQLEPLTPKNEPCESDFKESLDKLLSEVSRETV